MGIPVLVAGLARIAMNRDVRDAIVRAVAKTPVSTVTQHEIVEVAGKLATDPKFINATNAERPIQSRVTIGGSQSFIGGLAFLLPMILPYLGVNVSEAWLLQLFGAIVAVWGGFYTLWGRWAPDLKPLFATAWGKVMGALGLGSILAALVLVIIMVLR